MPADRKGAGEGEQERRPVRGSARTSTSEAAADAGPGKPKQPNAGSSHTLKKSASSGAEGEPERRTVRRSTRTSTSQVASDAGSPVKPRRSSAASSDTPKKSASSSRRASILNRIPERTDDDSRPSTPKKLKQADDAPSVGTPRRNRRASSVPAVSSSPARLTRRSAAALAALEVAKQEGEDGKTPENGAGDVIAGIASDQKAESVEKPSSQASQTETPVKQSPSSIKPVSKIPTPKSRPTSPAVASPSANMRANVSSPSTPKSQSQGKRSANTTPTSASLAEGSDGSSSSNALIKRAKASTPTQSPVGSNSCPLALSTTPSRTEALRSRSGTPTRSPDTRASVKSHAKCCTPPSQSPERSSARIRSAGANRSTPSKKSEMRETQAADPKEPSESLEVERDYHKEPSVSPEGGPVASEKYDTEVTDSQEMIENPEVENDPGAPVGEIKSSKAGIVVGSETVLTDSSIDHTGVTRLNCSSLNVKEYSDTPEDKGTLSVKVSPVKLRPLNLSPNRLDVSNQDGTRRSPKRKLSDDFSNSNLTLTVDENDICKTPDESEAKVRRVSCKRTLSELTSCVSPLVEGGRSPAVQKFVNNEKSPGQREGSPIAVSDAPESPDVSPISGPGKVCLPSSENNTPSKSTNDAETETPPLPPRHHSPILEESTVSDSEGIHDAASETAPANSCEETAGSEDALEVSPETASALTHERTAESEDAVQVAIETAPTDSHEDSANSEEIIEGEPEIAPTAPHQETADSKDALNVALRTAPTASHVDSANSEKIVQCEPEIAPAASHQETADSEDAINVALQTSTTASHEDSANSEEIVVGEPEIAPATSHQEAADSKDALKVAPRTARAASHEEPTNSEEILDSDSEIAPTASPRESAGSEEIFEGESQISPAASPEESAGSDEILEGKPGMAELSQEETAESEKNTVDTAYPKDVLAIDEESVDSGNASEEEEKRRTRVKEHSPIEQSVPDVIKDAAVPAQSDVQRDADLATQYDVRSDAALETSTNERKSLRLDSNLDLSAIEEEEEESESGGDDLGSCSEEEENPDEELLDVSTFERPSRVSLLEKSVIVVSDDDHSPTDENDQASSTVPSRRAVGKGSTFLVSDFESSPGRRCTPGKVKHLIAKFRSGDVVASSSASGFEASTAPSTPSVDAPAARCASKTAAPFVVEETDQEPAEREAPSKPPTSPKKRFSVVVCNLHADTTIDDITTAFKEWGVGHIQQVKIFRVKSLSGKVFAKMAFFKKTALLKAIVVAENMKIRGRKISMKLKQHAK